MKDVDNREGFPQTGSMMTSLQPFDPASAPDVRVDARMEWDGSTLDLRFRLSGSSLPLIKGLWTSPEQPVEGPTDGLWESTCFEAFFGPNDSEVYYELNAAADGRWMVFRFTGERRGRSVHGELRPALLRSLLAGDTFDLTLRLDLARVPELRSTKLHAAPALVLESRDGSRSYWSLKHTPPKPDFHRPDHRVLTLAPA